jgi:hypothetical protein
MRRIEIAAVAALALLLSASILSAHHSSATLVDVSKLVRGKGVIDSVEWTNPHTLIFVDVTAENGQVQQQVLEAASPNTMIRSGYNKSSFKPGGIVEFCGYVQPITGRLAFPEITLPVGQRTSWLDDVNPKCGKQP